MANYEKLTQAGINVDDLIKRLVGNHSLIGVFIKKFTQDTTFEQLKKAFAEDRAKDCEYASHTLKGMCGNLSLVELYNLFSEQTNLLRGGDYQKAKDMMENITAIYNESVKCMSLWLEEN